MTILNYEVERMWHEPLITCFNVPFQHLPGGAERKNSGWSNSWSRIELSTSKTARRVC